jgi:hypothetical protein
MAHLGFDPFPGPSAPRPFGSGGRAHLDMDRSDLLHCPQHEQSSFAG